MSRVPGLGGGGDGSGRLPPAFSSSADRITYLLAEYKVAIGLGLAATAVAVGSGRAGLPTLPEWASLAASGFALLITPSIIAARLIIKRYFRDRREIVAELQLVDGEIRGKVHAVPQKVWQNRDRGRYPEFSIPYGSLDWIVTEYEWLPDVGEDGLLVVEGANPEVADPVDILHRDGRLTELYEEAQHAQAELAHRKATESSRMIRADARNVTALIEALEHGVAFDPGALDELDVEKWEDHDEGSVDERARERSDQESSDADTLLGDVIEAARGSGSSETNETTNGHRET